MRALQGSYSDPGLFLSRHDARGIGSNAKGHTTSTGARGTEIAIPGTQENARRVLHDDTYRSIPRVARCQEGLGKSFEKQSYPGPTQIPNAADALGVDPSRSEPFAVPPLFCWVSVLPSIPLLLLFDFILARIGCLPPFKSVVAPNTADCPTMPRHETRQLLRNRPHARQLRAYHPASQQHAAH